MLKGILHISSYFISTKLYLYIFNLLDKDYRQKIYVPYQQGAPVKYVANLRNGQIYHSPIYRIWHRVFYFAKMRLQFTDVLRNKLYEDVDLIHAHTLFADGVAAYRLHKKFGLKYVVSVRMTDVDLQYKYLLHRRALADKVLKDASSVVFISKNYKDKLLMMIPDNMRAALLAKSVIIPNGIAPYYLNNRAAFTPYHKDKTFHLLYVGLITHGKHVVDLLKAVIYLREVKKVDVDLSVAGTEDKTEKGYFAGFLQTVEGKDYIHYLGEVKQPERMCEVYSHSHLMILPSVRELFGLVFIESISQNTPVVYCKGAGIEPYIKGEPFAFAAYSPREDDLCSAILEAMDKYTNIQQPFCDFARTFDWNLIIGQYKTIYEKINNNEQHEYKENN